MSLRTWFYIILSLLLAKVTFTNNFYNSLQQAKNDSEVVDILLKIAKEKEIESADSAIKYYSIICDVTKNNLEKNTIHQKYLIKSRIFCLNRLGDFYVKQKKFDNALEYYFNALRIAGIYKLTKEQCKILQNIGNVYCLINSFDIALKYYKLSLSFAYATTDSNEIANCLQKIADVHFQKQNYSESLSLLNKTLFYLKPKDINTKTEIYLKIGDIYKELDNFDESNSYYQKALAINSEKYLAYIYLKISELYNCYELIEKSISYAFKALAFYEQENNLPQIAYCHTLIANNYLLAKNYSNSLKHFKIAEKTDSSALNHQFYEGIISCYLSLVDSISNNDEKQKLIKLAKFYNKKFYESCPSFNLILKEKIFNFYYLIYDKLDNLYFVKKYADSLLTIRSKIFQEKQLILKNYLQYKFQSEKENILKEKFLAEKKYKLEIKKLFTKLNVLTILLLFVLAVFGMFILYFIVKRKKYKNKIESLNNSFLNLEEKYKEKLNSYEIATEEIEKLKTQINKSSEEIKNNVKFAQLIQSYVIPNFNNEYIPQKFSYFIIYLPAKTLSGDFYWCATKNNKYYFAIGNTSYQGIQGALLSSMTIGILNEIFYAKSIEKINSIAKALYEYTFKLSRENDINFLITDFSIISINEDHKSEIISINSNILLYNSQKNKIVEFKDIRIPYNIIDEDTVFESEEITVSTNDIIYLYTNGVKEQSGGPEGKKLNIKNFKELLINISQKPMLEQKLQIITELDKWMKSDKKIQQTVDITIIGLKIKF
ncbi:MAG: tetratricopeptide repeat protein [Bacteroidales bacterium]|nr:tetratricopeptide repeat protein [Bacteroidales bacterium]